MKNEKDYSTLTLEELLVEEKKMKQSLSLSSGLVGFAAGVMIWGIINKGIGFLHIALPIGLMVLFYKNSQKNKLKLNQIQAEIKLKN